LKLSTVVTEENVANDKIPKVKTSLVKKKKSNKKKKSSTNKVNGQTVASKKPTKKKSKKSKKSKKRFQSKKDRIRKPLTDITLGSKISGKVVDICPFGAFIETEYAVKGSHYGCALLHISQIKDEKVEDISKELSVGQKLEDLRVVKIDHEKSEVALSLRAPRPKRKSLSSVMEGEELEGKVARITSYGAFIDVGCNVDALVHISRISQEKVKDINDFLKIGQEVEVRIISVDGKKKTLAGSMLGKQADQYLNRRREILTRQQQRQHSWAAAEFPKTDIGFFEDAIKDLEDAFQEDYGEWSKQ